jgi:alkylation response protein AidB-like acyl-CoA dehydrogenase
MSGALEAFRFGWAPGERVLLEQARAIATAHAPATRDEPLSPAKLRDIFRALEPTGYLGSILPPAAGGKGLSGLQFAALVEGLAPELTLVGNHSVQRYLHSFGTRAQCERFLPPLLSGEAIGGIAITEPQAGSDLGRIETRARRTGSAYVLDGRKTWVTHGMVASLFVVLASTGDGTGQLTRFLVPGDAPGLTRQPLRPVGLSHLTFADIAFQGCEVPAEFRLGEEGEGAAGAKAAFPIARMLAALQALRIARAALDMAADYARTRVVQGRPLADSSLVQHAYAQLWARSEAIHLMCLRIASDLAATDAVMMASAAKAMAGGLALEACRWASDGMGSAGLLDRRLERLHGDARMMSVVDGTSVLNDFVVARRTLGRASDLGDGKASGT